MEWHRGIGLDIGAIETAPSPIDAQHGDMLYHNVPGFLSLSDESIAHRQTGTGVDRSTPPLAAP